MQYHRQGSLQAKIKRLGPLPLEEVLRIGVKMAGALESAHRLGILHRDVKPANILVTDYAEPVLADFGIAHIAGGFETAAGTFTGSPAFTAPEILSGDPPSAASDVYGLGATLFAALTGHAAFERRSGEEVVAQFLRIASQPVPDLREGGIPDDISAVIETAMSRYPQDRPSALALGEELQRTQSAHDLPADEMALPAASLVDRVDHAAARMSCTRGGLPLELTSFIGRDAELGQVRKALAASRLVTLTGVGGVGKTRLARRVAAEAQHDFPDGVHLVELGELRDGSLLVDVVAAGLGLRDESARPLRDVLVDFVGSRRLLLVLDNCEQLIDDVARLVEELLQDCPNLRVLATSRERLGVFSESVVPIAPLPCPQPDDLPTIGSLSRFDAVALFSERAAAAAQDFRLSEENRATVADIVSRLEGVPLAIELAAARLRAMSLQQLRDRLGDRYKLLTRGSRGAPKRQQALSWSVGWSYDLCNPAEQQLWGRLTVFAGIFELDAAQWICGADMTEYELLDLLTSLVDKSILIRIESNGIVRFRMLETLREYGKQRVEEATGYHEVRRRHADWYRGLARDAFDNWFSPRQLDWLARVQREMPNFREALEFSLSEDGEAALGIAAALQPFWMCRGMLRESVRWTGRALERAPREPTRDRVQALFSAALVTPLRGDRSTGAARAAEARALAEKTDDSLARAGAVMADGVTVLMDGDLTGAARHFEAALRISDDDNVQVIGSLLLGWALEFAGESDRALGWQEKALALATSRGEMVYRSYALWELGIRWFEHGEPEKAAELLKEGLRLAQLINDRRNAAGCLEGLAWIAAQRNDMRGAAVMMAAADALAQEVGSRLLPLPRLHVFRAECERRCREALGDEDFDAAREQGASMTFHEAVAGVLGDGG